MNVVWLVLVWMLLMAAGMPVGPALLTVSLGFMHLAGYGLKTVAAAMINQLDSFPLLAVPLFILTACILNTGGITTRMFRFASVLAGHVTGGLGHVNVLASLFFSGMSGSAIADSGGLGKMEITAMREAGYDDDFSGSVTAASSIIGPLIPPSIPMVLYGVLADTSIGKMFLGGIIPGLLATGALMTMVFLIARKRGYPVYRRASASEMWQAFRGSFFALITPVIIIAGIFGGFFSPTEAAGVTVLYSLIIGVFVYRELNWKKVWAAFYETAVTASTVAILVMGVGLFSYIVAREQVSLTITEFFLQHVQSRLGFLLAVNLIIFVLGAFIESLVLMLVVIPILVAPALSFGIDPVHFGIIVVINLMISTLTPPMGVALFVVAKVGGIPFQRLARAIWVWLLPLVAMLLLVILLPPLATWLPSLVG